MINGHFSTCAVSIRSRRGDKEKDGEGESKCTELTCKCPSFSIVCNCCAEDAEQKRGQSLAALELMTPTDRYKRDDME